MIGIGRLWKTATGRDADARPSGPTSTIPREFASPKVAPVEAFWSDEEAGPSETRAADRFVPLRTTTLLNTASGRRLSARIINISRTGVAVEADFGSIGVDEIALVGTRPVMPGRRIALGAVFLFKKPLDPKLCDPSIVL